MIWWTCMVEWRHNSDKWWRLENSLQFLRTRLRWEVQHICFPVHATNICSSITVYPFGSKCYARCQHPEDNNHTVYSVRASGITFSSWCELRLNTKSVTRIEVSLMVLTHIALYHFYRLYSMLFYSCASLKDSHTFAWCEKWKQWTWMGNHWLMTTTVPSCPSHLELCPSVQILWRKLYQLYTSATPPVSSWSAKVHVEWNVRTLKLINLHFGMTGQTYFIVWTFIVWIKSFFCISTGLW